MPILVPDLEQPVQRRATLFSAWRAALAPKPGFWPMGLRVALLLGLTFACYLPVLLHGGFVMDDDILVTANPAVQADDGLARIWLSTRNYDYLPLTYTSWWLEWPLWGAHAAGYHAVNVALHAAGALLLWATLARLGVRGAWLGALLFAVHPVNAASAAWIAERKNTLSLVFYLLSAWLFLRAEDAWSRRGGLGWLGASLGAFALALLSKAAVVMLPVVLLGLLWWRRGRRPGWGDLVRTAPYFALSLIFGLVTIWFQYHRAIGEDAHAQSCQPTLAQSALGAGWAALFYLGKIAWPDHVGIFYPRWDADPAALVSYLPNLAVAAILWAGWLFRRRPWGRALLLAAGCYAVSLLPVLGFLKMSYFRFSRLSDHLVYLPALAIFAGLGATLASWRMAWVRRTAVVGMALVFGTLTWQHCGTFGSGERFWRAALASRPELPAGHYSLGVVFSEGGELPAAEGCYREALRLEPGNFDARFNLANTLRQLNRLPEAVEEYRRALMVRDVAKAHHNLGVTFLLLGDSAPAAVEFKAALRLDPTLAGAHFNLGKMAAQAGDVSGAVAEWQDCLRLDAADARALGALAELYLNMAAKEGDGGLRAAALSLSQRACEAAAYADPRNVEIFWQALLAGEPREEVIATGRRLRRWAAESGRAPLVADLDRRLREIGVN